MKLFLAGEHPVKNGKDMTKLFLAGEGQKRSFNLEVFTNIYILESFYYLQKNDWMKNLISPESRML